MNFKSKKHFLQFKYILIVIMLHIIGVTLLIMNSIKFPQLVGFGFLAYTLGLRHAFDADHITAIDNIVRNFVHQRRETAGVGFYFSLGHASVVLIMSVVTAIAMSWSQNHMPYLKEIGSTIGISVSGSFLLIIGLINLFVWFGILKLFIKARKGVYEYSHLEESLNKRGVISRLIGPFYHKINKSWHLYPVGFLFGLGFDTASEIALLAISANAGSQMIPTSAILSLPILFAAGMSLMDKVDEMFMTTAYDWAFLTPLRKIYYNLSVTGLSVIAALSIGFIELAQIIAPILGLNNGIWRSIANVKFDSIGYLLVGVFIIFWFFSYVLWRVLDFERTFE